MIRKKGITPHSSVQENPMRIKCVVALALVAGLLASLTTACTDRSDAAYRVETLVAGGPLHGPNGITFGPDGMLYVGSVSAETVYRVDVATGAVEVVVPAPDGEADDIAFAPDGTMVWTALISGEIRALRNDGSVYTIASNKALINPVYFTTDGRLFAAQKGFDRLYEFEFDIEHASEQEPRLVARKMGDINSFEITADDKLYAPLSNIGTVARIDIETGVVTPIAENLGNVIAVNLDSQGRIWAVDLTLGHLWRIDPDTGDAQIVATTEPPSDNLAVGADGAIYVSRTAASAIVRVDPDTGEQSVVVPGNFSLVGGLAVMTHQGREVLLVADSYGYRVVDTQTGAVTTTFNLTNVGFPNASSDVAVNDKFLALTDMVTRPRVFLVDRANYQTIATWPKIEAPAGVVLQDSGDPIVADFATGRIIGLSRADRKLRDILADGLAGPVGLAWAGPGTVYVTEALAGRLVHIDLKDGSKTIISEGLAQPEGLTVQANGRIVVVEVGKQRLIAVDPATGFTEVLATELPVGEPAAGAPEPVHVPSGVAEGADGSLYLTGDRDNSVLKLVAQ
jgi:sugar lactone lactonase YvrE